MALIFNKLMNSQQTPKTLHTKIIEALRSKDFKKSDQDSRNHLYFKIKPNKSTTQLIVPYKDLKDNFPYALIDFYEERIKITANNQPEQTVDLQSKEKPKNSHSKSIELKYAKNSKKIPHKKTQTDQMTNIMLEGKEQETQNNDYGAIIDYDKYLQQKEHSYKNFYVLFSESQSIENRYLKDLRGEDIGYGSKGGRLEVLEGKRKKQKLDYGEE